MFVGLYLNYYVNKSIVLKTEVLSRLEPPVSDGTTTYIVYERNGFALIFHLVQLTKGAIFLRSSVKIRASSSLLGKAN